MKEELESLSYYTYTISRKTSAKYYKILGWHGIYDEKDKRTTATKLYKRVKTFGKNYALDKDGKGVWKRQEEDTKY